MFFHRKYLLSFGHSFLVGDVLNYFIKDNDMQNHIDDIWTRIGNDMKSKGFSEDKIYNIINVTNIENKR